MNRKAPRVMIIGGGTGGLALAHGLKRAGIPVRVFERDLKRTDGLHGYRVGIDPDGSRALSALLPPDLYETFVATCARDPKWFCMLTEDLRDVLSLPLPEVTDPVESEKSVSRMTLRQVLMTGLEDVVEFGKRFDRYDEHPDGTVTAYFDDGTSATGDLLVGADGARSPVRQQRLPQLKTVDSGIVAIAGKLPITQESRRLLPAKVFDSISIVQAPHGYMSVLHVMEFKWGADGKPKDGIGGSDEELLREWPGLQFDNTRDYINWSLSAKADRFPANVMELRGDELCRLVLEMTPDWSPAFRRLVELSDHGTCFPINIQTSVPIDRWEPGTVTLIGDAAHTMTPGRGVGANTALRDAVLLCRNLVHVRDGRTDLVTAVGEYEERMVEYGFDAVLKSRKQVSGDDPLHKPVIGRVLLALTRTALRVVNHTPPLRNAMARSMLVYRGHDRDLAEFTIPGLS